MSPDDESAANCCSGLALKRGMLGLSVAAAVFTTYLTGVELFVLHAVWGYCVTSAVLVGLILVLTAVVQWLGHRPQPGLAT